MYDLPLPACRQFLCTHRDLRTCYRRAEKRCWVRDSCKPPGCTSPPRLHQPPHACPAQPSIHPSFSRTFSSLPPSLLASTPCYKTPLLSVSPRSQLVFSAWISPIIFFFFFFFSRISHFSGHRSFDPSLLLVDFLVSFPELLPIFFSSPDFNCQLINVYNFFHHQMNDFWIDSSFPRESVFLGKFFSSLVITFPLLSCFFFFFPYYSFLFLPGSFSFFF